MGRAMAATEDILSRCRRVLAAHYGARLRKVVLYGSAARGEAGPQSDLDLLVVLEEPVDLFAEVRRLVDLLYPLQLESDRYISAKPAPARAFEAGRLQLYRTAQREGVAV
jgi:hypothetical protein